jgi:hypothetical protein
VINGAGFDPTRDGNAVMVGGFRALVLEAAVNRLRVVTHQDTVTGPVRVTIAGNTITSASNFQVLPHPDQGDITQDGPPRTFVGPQPGTPTAKGLNQKVLAILVYPSDQDPGTPTDRTNKRNEQISRFNNANRFYQEATFGATSFLFDSTDWLALPQNRDFYIWQADDIFRARRSLYRATRVDIKINGAQAYLAHWQGFTAINISNPSSLSPTGNYALLPPIPATAIHSVGGQAYVGYGTNGIHILNIPASGDPTVVGSLPDAAWVADLDFSNNILYVAAEDQGLHVINTTTSPAGIHSLALPDWAMGVRVSGSNAYVAAGGAGLVVVDVHDPSNLTTTGTLSFGGEWAVAIDLSGTIAYVATDGDGIKIVDITNSANPTLRSTDRTVLRPRGVAVVGTTLYVAAADQGLRILNVSNPDSPSEIGHLDVEPAFSVAVSGSTAYVALGAGTIQAVDVSDPAHPSSRGSYNATTPGTVVPLDTLRNQLDTAIASQGFLQQYDAFLADSFQAAQSAGFDLSQYQGFIIVQHGPFLRGQSWTDTGISYNGVHISFGGTRGLIYLAYDATWGRRAHEIGHWLGLGDVYQDYHPDGTYTLGTAGPWDLMGEHDGGPLFSGFHMDKLQYFHPSNVVQRTWTLGGPAVDETFAIVAHDRTENTDAGKTHLLRLQVAEGLIYFVEVRQRPGVSTLSSSMRIFPFPAIWRIHGKVV